MQSVGTRTYLQDLLDLLLCGSECVHDIVLDGRVRDLLSPNIELLLVRAELGAHDEAELDVVGNKEIEKPAPGSCRVVRVGAL